MYYSTLWPVFFYIFLTLAAPIPDQNDSAGPALSQPHPSHTTHIHLQRVQTGTFSHKGFGKLIKPRTGKLSQYRPYLPHEQYWSDRWQLFPSDCQLPPPQAPGSKFSTALAAISFRSLTSWSGCDNCCKIGKFLTYFGCFGILWCILVYFGICLTSDELVCSIDLIQHHWSSWLRQGDLLAMVIPILFMYKNLFFRKSWMHMLNCWQSWLPFRGTLSVTISCRSCPVSIFHILMLLLRIKISSLFTSSELASLPAMAKSLPCRAKHLSRLK